MSNSVFSIRLKSCVATALLSIILLFPTVLWTNAEPSPIWMIYDRDDPDIGHSGTDPLAVRFTPPRIWLGMGCTCTLFEVTAIRLYVSSDSWIGNAGFDVYVTDENHQTLKSFMNQHPTENGWFNLDLTGWTDDTRYVETHFFVEFVAHAPVDQESWTTLMFDEAVVDEGEASYHRSYRYTYGPDNPNIPAWLPIELTYPYTPGDLLIRTELEPEMPESLLPNLVTTILAADARVFAGYEKGRAPSIEADLIEKIGEVISMFEVGNWRGGLSKLENDIAPKLADPRPTPRTSWLHVYEAGSANQKLVTSFAVQCRGIVQMAEKAVPLPPGLLEHFDFNGDGCDDLAVGVPGENIEGEDDAGAVNVLYGSPIGICQTGDDYWHQNIAGVDGECEENDRFGAALAIGNFNGDTYDDLVIGVPGDEVDDVEGAGAVYVLYGSPSGLTTDDDQLWHLNSEGISGICQEGDSFGAALAVGDFNGDGYGDLAIGIPNAEYYISDSSNLVNDHGAVLILHGSSGGLIPDGYQFWDQSKEGIEGMSEEGDHFGTALATGDFDGDGFDDLAIGTPTEDYSETHYEPDEDQGVVNVLYGSFNGLSSFDNQLWSQDSPGILDESEPWDLFGASLAAGDFNWDGYDDLAIGVPCESLFASGGTQQWAEIETGAVNVICGSSIGLTAAGNQFIEEEWCEGEFADYDHFGASLAVGDFDINGYMDLAVGTPNKYIGAQGLGSEEAGALYVIFGSEFGLEWSDNCAMWIGADMAYGSTDEYDHFGKALNTGDFDGDSFYDLAIGVPGKDILEGISDWITNAGTVDIMYGYDGGLYTWRGQTWHQNMAGIGGTSEEGDSFGSSLPGSHWDGI